MGQEARSEALSYHDWLWSWEGGETGHMGRVELGVTSCWQGEVNRPLSYSCLQGFLPAKGKSLEDSTSPKGTWAANALVWASLDLKATWLSPPGFWSTELDPVFGSYVWWFEWQQQKGTALCIPLSPNLANTDLNQERPGAGDECENRQKFLPPLGFTVSSNSRWPTYLVSGLLLFEFMGLLDYSRVT